MYFACPGWFLGMGCDAFSLICLDFSAKTVSVFSQKKVADYLACI